MQPDNVQCIRTGRTGMPSVQTLDRIDEQLSSTLPIDALTLPGRGSGEGSIHIPHASASSIAKELSNRGNLACGRFLFSQPTEALRNYRLLCH